MLKLQQCVLLTEQLKDRLAKVASEHGVTQNQAIRSAIHHLYRMNQKDYLAAQEVIRDGATEDLVDAHGWQLKKAGVEA